MKIKVLPANIIKFILFYSIVTNFLVLSAGFPSMLLYLNDLLVLGLLIRMLWSQSKSHKIAVPKASLATIGALVLVVLLSYTMNLYSPLLLAWGLRNNFRAIIFFFACCMLLEKKDVNSICNLLLALLPLNAVLCTVQYISAINSSDSIVLKFYADHVGGIFGNQRGCNRMLNIYITFMFSWVFAQLLQKKCSRKKAAWVFACCVYMSILSELKIVVVEFVAIMILLIWLIRRRINRVLMMILGATVAVSAISILRIVDPTAMGIFEDLDLLLEYVSTSSYGENSLNRLTVIPYIQERFFEGNIFKTLFGVGLGNADGSNFAFLTSSNYLKYGYLKYHYFMSGYLYFEVGLLGLILYLLIFVVMYFSYARKLARRKTGNALEYTGVVFNVIAVLCVFYNTSLRSEVSCYMSFFFLAIPIIWENRRSESDDSYLYEKKRRIRIHW